MTLISVLLRATALAGAVGLVHGASARHMSAALRHFVWTLAVLALLLLPVLSFTLPGWTLVELPAPPTPDAITVVESQPVSAAVVGVSPINGNKARPESSPVPWLVVLPVFYAAVTIFLLARLLVERRSLQRLAGRAPAVHDPEWARLLAECAGLMGIRRTCRLLRSPDETMPMTFGILQPTILIPAVADRWSPSRRRAVLLHELAHVARWDCLTQMLAAVACACYWIHPLVWWIARRLRVERELACDDRVLMSGTRAREYAGDLLDLAYTLGSRRAPALAVSMAGSPHIEGRMLAVLDENRNRTSPTWHVRTAGIVLMMAMLVPVAVATTAVRPMATPLESTVAASYEFAQRGAAPTPQKPGTWEIRAAGDSRTIHLRLSEGDGSYGSTIDVDQLNGLAAALLSSVGGPAQFTLRRDAGVFHFEGIFRSGVGAGTYTFVPNPDFPDAMAKRGFARPTAEQQYLLARANFGFAFLDELVAQNYARPDLAQLIRAVQHGVSLTYLRDMGQLGYHLKVVDALITMRDHGVSPQYVRELTAEGLTGLSSDDLVRARDHGVSPEYVRELRAQGYQGLALDALVRLRDHGVSPQYLRDLVGLGYSKLPLETVVDLRNHGVSPEYVRDLGTLGYQKLPVEALIRLRNHGVSPEYVRELNALGYTSLTIDELVGLRNHGVSPERIRMANARAGTRLTVDALKDAASRGWR